MTRRGGALLAVLWLSAALSAIAFSVANTVRTETERTGTVADDTRAYYLATGALERALLYILIGPGPRNPDGTTRYWEPGISRMQYEFPSGPAMVEIIPESSKLAINETNPAELLRLMMHLGASPEQAAEITAAIVDWRNPLPPGALTGFDQFYLARTPSFPARHASLEEIEELLLVKGMTPELFHGGYTRDEQGRLLPRSGLKHCVSVYGTTGQVDANTADPAVLATIGLSPAVIAGLVERRHAMPFRDQAQLAQFAQAAGPAFARLTIGGGSIYTLRATARLRLPDGSMSDITRSVSGLVKFHKPGYTPAVEILRWYDN